MRSHVPTPTNTAQRIGTLIFGRPGLVWKILSGARLSRREEASLAKLSGLNLAMPDARHRRPLKNLFIPSKWKATLVPKAKCRSRNVLTIYY